MNRDYEDGEHDDVEFFTGIEVEKTPAYGLHTLFVVGQPTTAKIENKVRGKVNPKIEHIYLGANQSFQPETNEDWDKWDIIVDGLLPLGLLITIDHELKYSEWFLESCWADNNLVIPMISIPIPYLAQYGYNASFKIDDKDFEATNPGVWTHSMQAITNKESFTPWYKYKKDLPL